MSSILEVDNINTRSGNTLVLGANVVLSSTGFLTIPAGTTANRPGTPINGMLRLNTSNNWIEFFSNNAWYSVSSTNLNTYSVEYLLVAGGGSGGTSIYGMAGGGAGGVLYNSSKTLTVGTPYTVVVGAGASGTAGAHDLRGSNTTFGTATVYGIAFGGGWGGNIQGGSGGGGGHSNPPDQGATSIQTSNDGGTGYGNKGGAHSYSAPYYPCGGGGGAGGVGGNGSGSTAGAGGAGRYFDISGANVAYAGGGGANGQSGITASGGVGGGGPSAAQYTSNPGTSGTTNTGGGGGAGGFNGPTAYPGGNGGSGIVIIRYNGGQRGTGGNVTSVGGNTIHTFTSTGTFTFTA